MSWGIVYPPYSILNMGGNPPPQTRWVYNFNGVDNYIDTGQKIVDIDNLDGLTLEGVFDSSISGTMFSQSISSTAIDREFQIYNFGPGTDTMYLIVGGANVELLSPANMPSERGLYRFEFAPGNIVRTLFNGALLSSVVYIVGIKREPTATFRIMARGAGAGAVGFLRSGICYNVKINDGSVYNYPINDRTFGADAPIANSATVLGVELIDCTAAAGRAASLSNVTNNSMTLTNTIASYGTSEQVVNLEAGTYLLEFDTVNLSPSTNSGGFVTFTPYSWAERVATHTSVEGLNKTLITIPQSGTYNVWFHVGGSVQGDSRRYSNITLRKADGYATGVNLLESGWTEINL